MNARRPWAWPLVPLYATALAAKDGLRAIGLLQERELLWPVVSVGSLSAGGAGKTPVVIALAEMLSQRGWAVDVLSRGYRRTGAGVEQVVLDPPPAVSEAGAAAACALRFGDEPVLIASRTGVPVWVGADRFAAGAAAEQATLAAEQKLLRASQADRQSSRGHLQKFASSNGSVALEERAAAARRASAMRGIHLLDDGFQHRQLARAVDIVLVTVEDMNDALLPAGNRRETLAALRRADVVVVREDEVERRIRFDPGGERSAGPSGQERTGRRATGSSERIEAKLRGLLREDALVWTARRKLRFPPPLLVFGAGLRPVGFCAIARPESFAAMLTQAGCGVVETIFFDDHREYTLADIEHVIEVAKGLNATGLVTTEKDAVKLTPEMRARIATVGPLMVAGLDVEFLFPERVMRELEARLG